MVIYKYDIINEEQAIFNNITNIFEFDYPYLVKHSYTDRWLFIILVQIAKGSQVVGNSAVLDNIKGGVFNYVSADLSDLFAVVPYDFRCWYGFYCCK